jgi:4-amino-4-deoxy-L-arabinose transferase-like glycosyltransferase
VTRDTEREAKLICLLLFVVAFALRLGASLAFAGEPVWDGHYYDFGARRIAEGHGYSDDRTIDGVTSWHPWCHYPVGYSGFLALFYKVFGATFLTAHVANALTGAALVVVTYLLACEALSPARAKIAGALVAFHPGLVLYSALLMTEPLSSLLVLLGFLVAVRVGKTRAFVGVAAGAAILGVGALVRPQALLCAPFLALVVRDVPWPRRIAAAALACACAVVPVLPWTARNCRVMDGCALVSTNAGWNLAIGALPRASGRFEMLHADDGCREVVGQVQQDRCWLSYGVGQIRRDPGKWIRRIPAKLGFTFDRESFQVDYLGEARPREWPEERRATWRSALTVVHRLLLLAATFAFVAIAVPGRRDRRLAIPQTALLASVALFVIVSLSAEPPAFYAVAILGCFVPFLPIPGRPAAPPALLMAVGLVATTALTHAVFFGEDRYHVVATPALCLLAAAAFRAPATRAARSPSGARAAGESSS